MVETQAIQFARLDSPQQQPGPESRSLLNDWIHSAVSSVWHDDGKSADGKPTTRDEVEHYTGELAKSVPLFLLGSYRSYAAAALLYGLDQAKAGDTVNHQVTDFTLGAIKGGFTKATFETLGTTNLGIAEKGASMGIVSRFLDVGLTRQTYLDPNGKVDWMGGLDKTVTATANLNAIETDVVVFGAAAGLAKGLNVVSKGAMEASPFWRTVGTGTTFGISSGSLSEVQRQKSQGAQHIDWAQVAKRGLLEGGVTGLASLGGATQAARKFASESSTITGTDNGDATKLTSGTQPLFARLTNDVFSTGLPKLGRTLGGGDLIGEGGDIVPSEPTQAHPVAPENQPPPGAVGIDNTQTGDRAPRPTLKVESTEPAVAAGDKPDFDALYHQVNRADWSYAHEHEEGSEMWNKGKASVDQALSAVQEATSKDPWGAKTFLDTVSADLDHVDHNALMAAAQRGLDVRSGLVPPAAEAAAQSSEPVKEVNEVNEVTGPSQPRPTFIDMAAAEWEGTKYDGQQQDAHWMSSDHKVALVADGVGGSDAGEVASKIVADIFNRRYNNQPIEGTAKWQKENREHFQESYPASGSEQDVQEWLDNSIRLAHIAVLNSAKGTYETLNGETLKGGRGMASTIVATAQHGDQLLISWAGDSRAYRLRDGKLEQLTQDHTPEFEPGHVMYSAIGSTLVIGRTHADIKPGDRFIVATDGLETLPSGQIAAIAGKGQPASQAATDLLGAVKEAAAKRKTDLDKLQDNTTLIVLDPRADGSRAPAAQTDAPAKAKPKIGLDNVPNSVRPLVEEGGKLLIAATSKNATQDHVDAFQAFARERGATVGDHMSALADQLAQVVGREHAGKLVADAYPDLLNRTSDATDSAAAAKDKSNEPIVVNVPEGMEQLFHAGNLRLQAVLRQGAKLSDLVEFNRFARHEGTDLVEPMAQLAQELDNPVAQALVDVAYSMPNLPVELQDPMLWGATLLRRIRRPDYKPEDIQALNDFAQSDAGKRIEPEMLALGALHMGDDGAGFVRQAYHGEQARVAVEGTDRSVYVDKADEPRMLKALVHAQSEIAGADPYYYDALDNFAHGEGKHLQSALLDYATKSENPRLLALIREAYMTPETAYSQPDNSIFRHEWFRQYDNEPRWRDYINLLGARPEETTESQRQYRYAIFDWLNRNPDLHEAAKIGTAYSGNARAMAAYDYYFGTNFVGQYAPAAAAPRDILSRDSSSGQAQSAISRVDFEAAQAPSFKATLEGNESTADLVYNLNSPNPSVALQSAIHLKSRAASMTDEGFAQWLSFMRQAPEGSDQINYNKMRLDPVWLRPEIDAALNGEDAPLTIGALRRFMSLREANTFPEFPQWLGQYAADQHAEAGNNVIPDDLIQDMRARYTQWQQGIALSSAELPQNLAGIIQATPEPAPKPDRFKPGKMIDQRVQIPPDTMERRSQALEGIFEAAQKLELPTNMTRRLVELGAEDPQIVSRDILSKLNPERSAPEWKELLSLAIPNAKNVYDLKVLLSAINSAEWAGKPPRDVPPGDPEAAARAKADADRKADIFPKAKELALAAMERMLPAGKADQLKLRYLVNEFIAGHIRPPKKDFGGGGQDQAGGKGKGRDAKPQAPPKSRIPSFVEAVTNEPPAPTRRSAAPEDESTSEASNEADNGGTVNEHTATPAATLGEGSGADNATPKENVAPPSLKPTPVEAANRGIAHPAPTVASAQAPAEAQTPAARIEEPVQPEQALQPDVPSNGTVDFGALHTQVSRANWKYDSASDTDRYMHGKTQVEDALSAVEAAAAQDPGGMAAFLAGLKFDSSVTNLIAEASQRGLNKAGTDSSPAPAALEPSQVSQAAPSETITGTAEHNGDLTEAPEATESGLDPRVSALSPELRKVYDALDDEPRSARDISSSLRMHQQGASVKFWLTELVRAGLVKNKNGMYSLKG